MPQNGTVKLKEQVFQVQGALVNITMLLLACMSFALPTIFVNTVDGLDPEDGRGLLVSRVCSIFILASYVAYLIFQLYTHIALFEEGGGADLDAEDAEVEEQ